MNDDYVGEIMGYSIPLKSSDLEEIFDVNIAEYGYKNQINSTQLPNIEETYRTNIRRQRDKILYTGGFRRLQDKTQVISATVEGDHRTRLTHTLEVEQIAISIANALQLNSDLVSAIALGHDVGHTPFGHAAERTLCKLLKEDGQFHHPIQSVRYLWEKYGSKIEPEIYEGILLHDSDMFKIKKTKVYDQFNYLKKCDDESVEFENWVKVDDWLNSFPSTLEAQVVIWADKIAYITHDLEDFLRCSAYDSLKKNDTTIEKQLCYILNRLIINKNVNSLEHYESRDLIRSIISNLINSSVENINQIYNLQQAAVKMETEKRQKSWQAEGNNKEYLDSLIINFSKKYRDNYYDLRKFLDQHYILSPGVQKSDAKAAVIVEWLFNKLSSNYKLLPLNLREEIDNAIVNEFPKNKVLKNLYDSVPQEKRNVVTLLKKIKESKNTLKAKLYMSLKRTNIIPEEIAYENIKDKVVSRKVACYIATMSDSYAENMYRDLLGSKGDFIL